MKITTERLQEATSKAIKGAGFNTLIPLTSMIGIELKDNTLYLKTTDMTNNVISVVDKVAGEDVDVTIDADKFGKLIAKMTSTDITLTVQEDCLQIEGNGVYKLPLISDEDGLVEFPKIEIPELTKQVKLTSVMDIYNTNRYALAKTMEQPALTGYYCGKNVTISTDTLVITFNQFGFSDEDILISPQMMQLLTLNKQENISADNIDGQLYFATDDLIIAGPMLEGIEDYPVSSIMQYLDIEYESSCKIPKGLLLDVLDRLSLFIEPYDKNGAYFAFGRKGINIHSKKDASAETINYIDSKNFKPFVCCVDVPLLKEQLQSIPEDTVQMFYGDENALKLVCGKIVQVIALLEDEELGNE